MMAHKRAEIDAGSGVCVGGCWDWKEDIRFNHNNNERPVKIMRVIMGAILDTTCPALSSSVLVEAHWLKPFKHWSAREALSLFKTKWQLITCWPHELGSLASERPWMTSSFNTMLPRCTSPLIDSIKIRFPSTKTSLNIPLKDGEDIPV